MYIIYICNTIFTIYLLLFITIEDMQYIQYNTFITTQFVELQNQHESLNIGIHTFDFSLVHVFFFFFPCGKQHVTHSNLLNFIGWFIYIICTQYVHAQNNPQIHNKFKFCLIFCIFFF